MHLNRQLLLGRISVRGPKLAYNSASTPICSLTLEVDKIGRDGQTYTSYHKVEITGKFAPDLAVTLEGCDEILVEGEHQHRSLVDPKTSEKKKWCVLSTWGVLQRDAHAGADATERDASPESGSGLDEVEINHEAARRPRKRSYPKAALQGGFQN